jgi:hypothetical protein
MQGTIALYHALADWHMRWAHHLTSGHLYTFNETSSGPTSHVTSSSNFQQPLHPIYQLLFRAIHGNVIAFDTRDIDFLALPLCACPLLFDHINRRLSLMCQIQSPQVIDGIDVPVGPADSHTDHPHRKTSSQAHRDTPHKSAYRKTTPHYGDRTAFSKSQYPPLRAASSSREKRLQRCRFVRASHPISR